MSDSVGIPVGPDAEGESIGLDEYAAWVQKERHLERIRDEVLGAMSKAADEAITTIRKRETIGDDREADEVKEDAEKQDRRGVLGFSFYDQDEGDNDTGSDAPLDQDGTSTGSDEKRS